MRTGSWLLILFLWCSVPGPLYGGAAETELTAREIIDRVDRLLRGDSSHGKMRMSVATRRWKRSMILEVWSEGTEKALIRVLSPKKEEGTATLKIGSDIWNYLPKIDRTIRIPTSMMSAGWMGSHFSNDDLVKESRLVRDYAIGISFEGERDGVAVYEFSLIPHPQAPVVWGRISFLVRKTDLMPVSARFYSEGGDLKRTLVYSDYRMMGGRLVPSRMKMTPQDKLGEYTEILYEEMRFDFPIQQQIFSLSTLRRR